jgi:hypothetical protein
MPKRVIDGEALCQSGKLGHVHPVRFRAEYANLLRLALANGSFECEPRFVSAKVYAANRPDITPDDVVQILDEFERVKMLFRWETGGKLWGYWVGIDKPGRLPSSSVLQKKHYATGAELPQEEMRRFLAAYASTVSRQCLNNV